jgi:hypothetical protein
MAGPHVLLRPLTVPAFIRSSTDRDVASRKTYLEPRDWSSQAADAASGLKDSSQYKSLAIYAETKLAQALDNSSKSCPDMYDIDGELLPNKLRSAVCCQVRAANHLIDLWGLYT